MNKFSFLPKLVDIYGIDRKQKRYDNTINIIIENYILINPNVNYVKLEEVQDSNFKENIDSIILTMIRTIFIVIAHEYYVDIPNSSFKYIYANNDSKFKLFLIQMMLFNKKSTSIDFEFHKAEFKILQIKLDYIFIVEPYQTNSNYKELFIHLLNRILTSQKIIKILHGASQDLQLIFSYYLFGNKEKIIQFIDSFSDTALLCEYYKKDGTKCSLYNALLNFNVINDLIYKYLLDIEEKMPSYKKGFIWNYNKLDDNLMKYVYNDVLYLDDLYYAMNPNAIVNTFIRYTYLCRNNIIGHVFIIDNEITKYKELCSKLSKIDYIKKYVVSIFKYISSIKNKEINVMSAYEPMNVIIRKLASM